MRLILSAALLSAAFFAHAQATETAGRWWTEDKRDVLEVSPWHLHLIVKNDEELYLILKHENHWILHM